MAVKQITAEFVYTLTDADPIRNGFVEYDDISGEILSVGSCPEGVVVSEGALTPLQF